MVCACLSTYGCTREVAKHERCKSRTSQWPREAERLCFINRHFADPTEFRGFTILVKIMAKTSSKSKVTICKLISLRNKNTFNCTFPPRHTCLQRSPRISLFGIIVGQTSFLSLSYIRHYRVWIANHVIYLSDRD